MSRYEEMYLHFKNVWEYSLPMASDEEIETMCYKSMELLSVVWAEGANSAVRPVNKGTHMSLEAVIPFPTNPYVKVGVQDD